MARRFGDRVRYVVENYGDSELARRFGVTRYPVIFVDDILVAKPKDFGFYGDGEGGGEGRYTPFRSAEGHERFRDDLSRVIELVLAGRAEDASARAATDDLEVARLPAVSLEDLDGRPLASGDLRGRIVLVEFWATWCPPCRSTLAWLGEFARRHGDRVAVVAIAIESDEIDVRRVAASMALPVHWVMGTPDIARQFGDLSAVPTLFLFDAEGNTAATFLGAPPTLHAEVEEHVSRLLSAAAAGPAAQP